MSGLVYGLGAAVFAVFIGFSVAFMVSPDPTGVLPVALGGLLTVVLTPLLYIGVRRAADTDRD